MQRSHLTSPHPAAAPSSSSIVITHRRTTSCAAGHRSLGRAHQRHPRWQRTGGKHTALTLPGLCTISPLASSYNGPGKPARTSPTTINDSDFGAPFNANQPWYIHNIQGLKLSNVLITGKRYNLELSALPP
jgi:hypothetical protein